MSKRQELLDRIDELAREFGPHCPFATSVLHCLIGAMQTGVDREFAAATTAWMMDELCITAEMIEAVRGRRDNPSVTPSVN